MPAHQPPAPNLLPKTEFETSFGGRFLKWALSTGRYIIILTELVVIVAFLSRFKLDKNLSDLGEAIAGRQTLLEASSNTENLLRLTQARLDIATTKLKTQFIPSEIMEKINNSLTGGVILNTLSISKSGLSLTATTVSENDIGRIVTELSNDLAFKAIDLTDISSDGNAGIKFSLKITL